jgi:hypothetical protein
VALDTKLAQLLVLREMVAGALPERPPSDVDAHRLTESYIRLRAEARRLAEAANISLEDFDRRLPTIELAGERRFRQPPGEVQALLSAAAEAAGLLRQLEGWMNGVFDAIALDEGHDLAEIERARSERRR